MNFLNRLERSLHRKFGRASVFPYIIYAMAAIAVLDFFMPNLGLVQKLAFYRNLVFQGQVWRLITFLLIPPSLGNPIYTALMLFLYYHVGTALEARWGQARFLLYYLIGAVCAILAGLISGRGDSQYLYLSMYLAFAMQFPNYQLLLFFMIPVKIKWLALLTAAFLVFSFIIGAWPQKLAILFGLINFILFFGGDLLNLARVTIQHWKRRWQFRRNMRK